MLSQAFCQFRYVRMRTNDFCEEAIAGPQSGRIQEEIVRLLEELQARFYCFEELKPCFAFLVNPFIVNVVSDGCSVCQPFVTNLSAVETKLTFSKKNFSQCHFATNSRRQVPENAQNSKDPRTKHIAVTFCPL